MKRDADGRAVRYKARLVVCGSRDYTDVMNSFDSVVDFAIVPMLLSMEAQNNLELHQLDYNSAFLHGTLKRDVLMIFSDLESTSLTAKVCRRN